jgi:hypothetical protein
MTARDALVLLLLLLLVLKIARWRSRDMNVRYTNSIDAVCGVTRKTQSAGSAKKIQHKASTAVKISRDVARV